MNLAVIILAEIGSHPIRLLFASFDKMIPTPSSWLLFSPSFSEYTVLQAACASFFVSRGDLTDLSKLWYHPTGVTVGRGFKSIWNRIGRLPYSDVTVSASAIATQKV